MVPADWLPKILLERSSLTAVTRGAMTEDVDCNTEAACI